jgi:hypothetical protein
MITPGLRQMRGALVLASEEGIAGTDTGPWLAPAGGPGRRADRAYLHGGEDEQADG